MGRSKQHCIWVLSLVLSGMLLGGGAPAMAAQGNDASGKKLYLTYCFLCHGATGKGDGFAAAIQPTKPRNLTDDAHMSARTDQQLFDAISGGGAAFHGSITMPYWRDSLTEAQIWDLVAYLRTVHRPPTVGNASHGAALYANYCWTCHGKGGKGDGPVATVYKPPPRALTDQAYLSTRTDHDLYNAISHGGGAVDRSAAMPAWGAVLAPQEIWDLVAYVRQLSKQQ
jgi:cytochrome c oxidase cbb3-type subunit 3